MLTRPLRTVTTDHDGGVHKCAGEKREPRSTASGWNVGGSGSPVDDQPDDLIKRLRDPAARRDFKTLSLFGPHGVGCQITAKDALTTADGKYLADTIVDFHNMTLLMIHETQLPTDNPGKAAAMVREAEHIVIPKEVIPQQTNDKDCGVFVCMYMKALVRSDFTTVRKWVSCDGVTAKDFRRGMRADVCSLAAGELMVQLLMEGVVVPLQPIPVVGDQGVLLFPRGDDVRLELARLSRDRTNMELDGFVMASAITSIARALGYNLNELRAACAHELGTCGTPLLVRSHAAENLAERQACKEMLADMLHEKPEPLPPSPAIWSHKHQDETDAALKARIESTEMNGPNTPDTSPGKGQVGEMRKTRSAAARAKAGAGIGEKKRGGTSEYTGVWFETRVRKWCTKLTADPSTCRQVRLGAYQREEDAAYAYAAGAFVIRRKDTFPKVMELNAGEMAALEGCIEDDVRHLVHKRQWYRWREWRKAMDDIGVKPGTPFELEKSGKANSQAPRHGNSVVAPGEAGNADGESVEGSPGAGSDASSPEPNPTDAREGESSASRGTATLRRKEGPCASVGNGSKARPEKRRKVSDLPGAEEEADAPPPEPEPESSDDDPNEALPRVNAAADDDAEETNEERSDSAPVTRVEFDAMRKTQQDTAVTLARLETALLASLANHTAKKRKSDNARVDCDRATNARKGRRVATPEESELDEDEEICEQLRVHLFIAADSKSMTFYPCSAAKTAALCAVIENLPLPFSSLALAADKARRSDLNRTLSDWKTAAAGRVRDIALPKLGLFRDERDARSPWAAPRARSAARVRERLALTLDGEGKSHFEMHRRPRMINGTVTLKLYHMAWLEHVVTDAIRFWETRKGRLSNSAGVNAQIVDGLRECALTDVMAAVDEFQPAYDAPTSSWAWGRHGLRLSSCGIERQATAAPAGSESVREGDNLSLN
ncbi:unnamed protein product [Closterium sp. Naga37s-1]|nr:unnamed protein product [Closterium sp. Naga37s-1]